MIGCMPWTMMATNPILCKASQGHDRELNLAAATGSRERQLFVFVTEARKYRGSSLHF